MKLSHILAIILALVICVVIYFVALSGHMPLTGSDSSSDPTSQFNSAGALYSQSVDLANAGKYTEALQAADQALAQNATSLAPIIQANRAGILVMLGRYEEANAAADIAIAAPGNLTTTWSIAYYNKGDALRHLDRIDEAKAAYAKAAELDPTLVNPYKT
jgi:tetratricopeptide (TPR) repeat protein